MTKPKCPTKGLFLALSREQQRKALSVEESVNFGPVEFRLGYRQAGELSRFAQVMEYKNWRGETAKRRIIPVKTWLGATEWHPEFQWLMTAFDLDKGALRDFALRDCKFSDEPIGGTSFDFASNCEVQRMPPMSNVESFVRGVVQSFSGEAPGKDIVLIAEALGLNSEMVMRYVRGAINDGDLVRGPNMGYLLKTGVEAGDD